TGTLEGHGGHWYFYILASFLVFMPSSGFLIVLIRNFRIRNLPNLDVWCWSWFLVVFILFSFSKTQLPHYLLYGATPIFILMAKYREKLNNVWLVFLPAFIFVSLFFFLPEIAKYIIATDKKDDVVAMLKDGLVYLDFSYRIALAFSLLCIFVACFIFKLDIWKRQLLVAVIFSVVFIHKIVPAFSAIQQNPVVEAAAFTKKIQAQVVMYHHDMPSFSVYLGRVVEIREPKVDEILFTGIEKVKYYDNHTMLFQKGGVALIKINQPRPLNEVDAK
ncbi:MAG: glycosyltransferase family 39 protein, partial [Gammaproteobacteria bacterium]|nr:glycosyltransferase family 39 protein [Gammaproteobacteria bacterium]